MSNSVFMNAEPHWANACVGENGQVNYLTYAKGYSKASKLLLEHVLQQGSKGIDSLIYPICFNMRHSIELRLKGAIENIQQLAKIKNRRLEHFNLNQSHDILNIWTYFQKESEELDYRFKIINDLLHQKISDIGAIDPTGQTFRYPYDNNNKKHLVKNKVINYFVLRDAFVDLEHNLDELDIFITALIEEYKTGTFTSNFSRNQIFRLAQELPNYKTWSTHLNKESMCNNYNLSNRELGKILNIIKNNYETSPLIGLGIDFIYIKDETLIQLCEVWANYINIDFRAPYIGSCMSSRLDDRPEFPLLMKIIKEENNRKQLGYEKIYQHINTNFVCDLWALFYLSVDGIRYSELYFEYFDTFKEEVINTNNCMTSFEHIFSKPSFLEHILKSIYFLKKNELADNIVRMLDIESCFNFIHRARDRSLFTKWELLDY